jgi:cytochrome c-type biogenesis protein
MRVPIAAAGSLVRASSAVRHVAPVALDVDIALYELQLTAESLVASQLQTLTPWSALTLYAAGLLTSLTPCCLSLLPLTVAYFASDGEADAAPGGSVLPALAFTAGLASVLAGLGVAAASVGNVFGDAGGSETLRVAASLLAIVFGLNLLQVVPLQLGLGSLVVDPSSLKVPRAVRAYIFGASSALVASPCASPVLATILGFVASLGQPLLGGALLIAYTLGYTTPVGMASLLTSSAAQRAQAATTLEGRFGWVQPAGGAFLVSYGTYQVLVATLGAV